MGALCFPNLGRGFPSEDGGAGLPNADSLGPGRPFITQRGCGAKMARRQAASDRAVVRNPVETHRRRAGSGLRALRRREGCRLWEEGQCPLHPLASIGISVEMFARADMETQCLLRQAESLGGRTISGMPGMANLGVFPGPGHKATRNPPPRARESHPFKHSLAHSFNKHQPVYIRHRAGVVEIHPTRYLNSRRPQSGGETGV